MLLISFTLSSRMLRIMKNLKQIVASCIFLLVLGAGVFFATQVFKPEVGTFIQQPEFYKLPKNSLDFVVVGSSHAYCTFNPARLKRSTGLTSFAFASPALSFPGRACYMKEVFKTQTPKIVYMDASGVDLENVIFEKHRHENFTHLPISINRYQAAFRSVRPHFWEEMVFPLKLYHSDWPNLIGHSIHKVFAPTRISSKGYVELLDARPIRFAQDNPKTKVTIDKQKLKMLDEIVDTAVQHNAKLVFFAAPESMKDQTAYMRALEVRYKDNKNVSFLNMGKWVQQANLDPNRDFYDSNHLNVSGVKKITPLITDHLMSISEQK